MTNPFKISTEEKNRILGLHETYKNNQGGLIIEQETEVIAVDNKNPNYETEMAELLALGYEEYDYAEDVEDLETMTAAALEQNIELESLYDLEGTIITFTREKTETADWNDKGDKGEDGEDGGDKESNVRDDEKIKKAQRDFDAYYNNKISGQQVNIYSSRKSRDKQKQKGGFMDKGLIATVTFAKPSGNNPLAIRNKKNQIIGMELGLTDDKGSVKYKCSGDLNKLEASVQYIKADGSKGGRWNEWIGPKEFVDVAMKTLCSKLQIYAKEMGKVPATSKFGSKTATVTNTKTDGLFSS